MVETVRLDADERRVLGVLIEKSLTTPQYYPLTINGIVTGCNQKSNRFPLVEMVDDEVEEVLQRLRTRDLVTVTFPASGRTEKWRQELTSVLELTGKHMAVVAELLLRGPQGVGELRGRAARMKPIADVRDLEEVLADLAERQPPLVKRLSPEGVKRGARVTHALYPEEELAEIVEREALEGPAPAAVARSRGGGDLSALQSEVAELRRRVEALEGRLGGG